MAVVRTSVDGPVASVVLSRPDSRNAVSAEMLSELLAAFGDLAVAPEVRVVVLSGEGRDFCAGADFSELEIMRAGPSEMDYGRSFEELLEAIATHPVPVVASVQGAALGAGCQILVACDLAVVASDAKLGIPMSRLGLVINFENIQRLVLAVGPKRAGDVLFTGRVVSGDEAAAWGLVNQSVPPGELEGRTGLLVDQVVEAAPLSVRASKRGIGVVLEHLHVDRMTEGHRTADFDMMAAAAFASEDLQEGIRAFRERRRPRFRGE
ncbi:MAG: enoyl-CoA hydratase/isomerase family protein [Actinobacteria bacterium]|nr:enoyl-CoA hydratase/isomerase family protein [Actinomycetota bacterium]